MARWQASPIDLDDIWDYIAEKSNPDIADNFPDKIKAKFDILSTRPLYGCGC